ncbi:RIO kinase 2 [Methanococcus voltae]|nr:RIO kinase 2 [Methanococcus voltae]
MINIKDMEDLDWRILRIVEICLKNHEWVPIQEIVKKAKLNQNEVSYRISRLIHIKMLNSSQYGYRISHWGYDALALDTYSKKDLIVGMGGKVGVGKEGDVYNVLLPDNRNAVLKFHKHGRTCFTMGKRYRNYLADKRHISWLYSSRLAAEKEFEVLTALYPIVKVPEPIANNRHTILMGKMEGTDLKKANLRSLGLNPEELFDEIIEEVKKSYKLGYIHGDLSEFNILINSDGDFVIIDWPQVIEINDNKFKIEKISSKDVEYDVEYYLKRDIGNLLRYFKKYGLNKDLDTLYDYIIN